MKLLDLFSCAGGAGVGYHRAGFEVTGVDIEHQPNYPYTHFIADALHFAEQYGETFDAIHASPPCQGYTALAAVHGNEWPMLIEPVRELLDALGKPYVIENVQGAPLRRDLTLCGEMFGLGVIRHRYFELGGWSMPAPEHKPHRGRVAGWRHGKYFEGPYFAVYGLGGGKGSVAQWQTAMGIDWTTDRHELAEAVPPSYTQFIGAGLMAHLERELVPTTLNTSKKGD